MIVLQLLRLGLLVDARYAFEKQFAAQAVPVCTAWVSRTEQVVLVRDPEIVFHVYLDGYSLGKLSTKRYSKLTCSLGFLGSSELS